MKFISLIFLLLCLKTYATSKPDLERVVKSPYLAGEILGADYTANDLFFLFTKAPTAFNYIKHCSTQLDQKSIQLFLDVLAKNKSSIPIFLYLCPAIDDAFTSQYKDRLRHGELRGAILKNELKDFPLNNKASILRLYKVLESDPELALALTQKQKENLIRDGLIEYFSRDLVYFPASFFDQKLKDLLIQKVSSGLMIEPPFDLLSDHSFAIAFENAKKEFTLKSGFEVINYPQFYQEIKSKSSPAELEQFLKKKGYLYFNTDVLAALYDRCRENCTMYIPKEYIYKDRDYDLFSKMIYNPHLIPDVVKNSKDLYRAYLRTYNFSVSYLPSSLLADHNFVREVLEMGIYNSNFKFDSKVICNDKIIKLIVNQSAHNFEKYKILLGRIPKTCLKLESLIPLFEKHPELLAKYSPLSQDLKNRFRHLGSCSANHFFAGPYIQVQGKGVSKSYITEEECKKSINESQEKNGSKYFQAFGEIQSCGEMTTIPEPIYYTGSKVTFYNLIGELKEIKSFKCSAAEIERSREHSLRYISQRVEKESLARCSIEISYPIHHGPGRGLKGFDVRTFLHPELLNKETCLNGGKELLKSMDLVAFNEHDPANFGFAQQRAQMRLEKCPTPAPKHFIKKWGYAGRVIAFKKADDLCQ